MTACAKCGNDTYFKRGLESELYCEGCNEGPEECRCEYRCEKCGLMVPELESAQRYSCATGAYDTDVCADCAAHLRGDD